MLLLRENLELYTRERLHTLARNFEMTKYSKLRKEELIDQIVDNLCTEKMIRKRVACLTNEELELFRRACDTPQEISSKDLMSTIRLHMCVFGAFDLETDEFSIFEEVSSVFKRIDDEAFREEQAKKGWLMKCINFFIHSYGIAPLEVLYELYKIKRGESMDEMISMLWEMPEDITESDIFPMESIGLEDWPKDEPLYSKTSLYVHIPVMERDELDELLECQKGKTFYIPTEEQIEDIDKNGYEKNSDAYIKLRKHFMKKMGVSYEKASSWCLKVWMDCCDGESPVDVLGEMLDEEVGFKSQNQMNKFMGLLMEAQNNTRMKENRGHTPNELPVPELAGGIASDVTATAYADALFREAVIQFNDDDMLYDLDDDSDTFMSSDYSNEALGTVRRETKKIYPNDPCPCGSGKKYKKCCGRN